MLHGVGELLLGAVGGYWVLERASAHKGSLKRIGQWVGSFVIVVSIIGTACHVSTLAASKGSWCPLGNYPMKKGWMRPASSSTTATPSTTPSK